MAVEYVEPIAVLRTRYAMRNLKGEGKCEDDGLIKVDIGRSGD